MYNSLISYLIKWLLHVSYEMLWLVHINFFIDSVDVAIRALHFKRHNYRN